MKRPPALSDVTGRERGSVGSRAREGDREKGPIMENRNPVGT